MRATLRSDGTRNSPQLRCSCSTWRVGTPAALVGIVVVRTEQIERARLQCGDAAVPPGIDPAFLGEMRYADILELAAREVGAEVADVAVALADEDLKTSLRGERVTGHRLRVATLERIAKVVEGRALRHDRLLERGQRLGNIDEHALGGIVRGRGWNRCA